MKNVKVVKSGHTKALINVIEIERKNFQMK